MGITHRRLRTRTGIRWRALVAGAVAIVCSGVLPWTNSHAQASPYTLNWSSITAGGVAHLHSSCFELSGSIDFIGLPGILSASPNNYVVYTGFWAAAPIFGLDEIFFNGFEDCKL